MGIDTNMHYNPKPKKGYGNLSQKERVKADRTTISVSPIDADSLSAKDVFQHFRPCGAINSVSLVKSNASAYVYFEKDAGVTKARRFHGTEFGGETLRVQTKAESKARPCNLVPHNRMAWMFKVNERSMAMVNDSKRWRVEVNMNSRGQRFGYLVHADAQDCSEAWWRQHGIGRRQPFCAQGDIRFGQSKKNNRKGRQARASVSPPLPSHRVRF
jgi:RNA recognition motif-containing protein